MKAHIFHILVILLMFSCSEQDHEKEEQYINNAKVIKATCGGTVVQILKPGNIGSNWIDATEPDKPIYMNCVLIGNIPSDKRTKGSIISIKYEIVDQFEEGNFCDIGGLPPIKAWVVQFYGGQ